MASYGKKIIDVGERYARAGYPPVADLDAARELLCSLDGAASNPVEIMGHWNVFRMREPI